MQHGRHGIVQNPAAVFHPGHPHGLLHTARPLLRHARHLRFGLPAVWWGGPGVYSYDPAVQAAPSEEPGAVYPTDNFGPGPEGYPVPVRRGCFSQDYKVPAEGGGERIINVVRC